MSITPLQEPEPAGAHFQKEVRDGQRFEFGANWRRFLSVLNEDRIALAEQSLRDRLAVTSLVGRRFLDVGSGSGLFSLAARRLGATVHSFDYDPQSVACTRELKRRYFPDDGEWTIDQASVLDGSYMDSLSRFDVVYSWGVLHHTGAMWPAIENAISRVALGGQLFLAIYNDQGWKSHIWWMIKFFYNKLPRPLNYLYAYGLGFVAHTVNIIRYSIKLRPMVAIRPLLNYGSQRGMSGRHDLIDWMGGFPFEFARYDVLLSFLEARGFALSDGRPASSLGCHELIMRRG